MGSTLAQNGPLLWLHGLAATIRKAAGKVSDRDPYIIASMRVEQMRLLYKSPLPLLANPINATIVVAVAWGLWSAGVLLTWLGLVVAVTAARYALWRRVRAGRRTGATVAVKARLFTLGAAATGALWGMTSLVVLATDAFPYHAFVGFVIAGTTAGAVAVLAIFLPALYAFLVPAVAPLALTYFLHGGAIYLAMGAMTLFYGVMMAAIAHGSNRALLGSLRLQIKNAELADRFARACTAALDASQAKSRFLAQMSHELRTPLNAIIGFSELLATETYGPLGDRRYEQYAQHIHESGNTLLNVIDTILKFTKADAGALRLAEDAVVLPALLERCLASVSGQALARGLSFDLECRGDLPALRADPTMLMEIVVHLLINAVKFSIAGGRITLSAREMSDGAIRVGVSDNGIGMDPEEIPAALAPFTQLDARLSRRYSGLGLGLTLTRILVELHDGNFMLDTAKGAGTTVTVTFPPERSLVRYAGHRVSSSRGREHERADNGDRGQVRPDSSAAPEKLR